MKGIIIYKGKYGATRQYADWLSEKLSMPALPASDIMKEQLDNYDFIILGSSVYYGKLLINSWLQENIDALSGKKIFFFLVSATQPTETVKLNDYIQSGVPEAISKNLSPFFLVGKLKMKELSWRDRFILRMGALLAKKPSKKKMLKDFNEVKIENLDPLVNDVTSFIATSYKKIPVKPIAILPEYF